MSGNKKMSEKEFNIIKTSTRNISDARKAVSNGSQFSNRLPWILGLKLTNRCNLRCAHCYEWNDKGYHNNMSKEYKNMDLDLSIIQKCIDETRAIKSTFYLWGGEPLIYNHIDELLTMLAKEKRITAICTNGIEIINKIDLILGLGENLELLIALDGEEENNDAIRGKGTYKKVINAIDELLSLRGKGVFKGKISIHTVISNDNVEHLYEYVKFMNSKNIDSLILCMPWYISEQTSCNMDSFYKEHFDWLLVDANDKVNSWDAFKYKINEEKISELKEKINKIKNEQWDITVKFQPDIELEYVSDFINGKEIINKSRKTCLSIASRMDILPNGRVTSCKHFPEFSIGNLSEQSVSEIWNSDDMNRIRGILFNNIMPVCSKCNNLYLHGYKVKD